MFVSFVLGVSGEDEAKEEKKANVPTVFIYYSADECEAFRDRVRALADILRKNGIDAQIDQYLASPPASMPLWIHSKINNCQWTIIVWSQLLHQNITRINAAPKANQIHQYKEQGIVRLAVCFCILHNCSCS